MPGSEEWDTAVTLCWANRGIGAKKMPVLRDTLLQNSFLTGLQGGRGMKGETCKEGARRRRDGWVNVLTGDMQMEGGSTVGREVCKHPNNPSTCPSLTVFPPSPPLLSPYLNLFPPFPPPNTHSSTSTPSLTRSAATTSTSASFLFNSSSPPLTPTPTHAFVRARLVPLLPDWRQQPQQHVHRRHPRDAVPGGCAANHAARPVSQQQR
eukprot:202221-Chlamydomonas_euryale.AAC.2